MNFENILTVLLSATIPSIITYLVTKKTCDSKIEQIKISKDSEINQLKKESKSNDMSSKLTEMFLKGELDMDNINNSIPKLKKMDRNVTRMKNKQETSNFIKKQKR